MDNPFPSTDRLILMQRGVNQLLTWLNDLLRVGLLEYDFSPESLQELAGRMIDAKLGGIARRIRLLSELQKSDPYWSRDLVHALTRLYLFASNFQKLDSLSPLLQQTLLSVAGFTIKKDQLPQDKSVVDHWVPTGITYTQEENLKVRRCWLMGLNSKRVAMLLDFAWGRMDFTQQYAYNEICTGSLVYYPSTFPLRAQLFNPQKQKKLMTSLPAFRSFDTFLLQYAKAFARNPWIGSFPGAFTGVKILYDEGAFFLLDERNAMLPMCGSDNLSWSLMAMTNRAELQIFGEWNGYELSIFSYLAEGKIRTVTSLE